jgi:hypothetical protein
VHIGPGSEQRTKEAQPLEMVHVKVPQEDVQLVDRIVIDRDAERAHAGTGVEHERRPPV